MMALYKVYFNNKQATDGQEVIEMNKLFYSIAFF